MYSSRIGNKSFLRFFYSFHQWIDASICIVFDNILMTPLECNLEFSKHEKSI